MDAFRGRFGSEITELLFWVVKTERLWHSCCLSYSSLWPASNRVSYCCRSQTTKGIWIAKCVGIEPATIAMDLEGTDGRERGEVINSVLFYIT